jgi:alpha-1,3-rhamnosyl/mannosyltransferase
MLKLTRAVWRERLDVFFSPSVYGYFPLPPRLPAVVTVHDAIPERFPTLTLPTLRDRVFWRAKMRLALWQARLVLTVSPYAARELTALLGIDPSRLRVTLEGASPAYFPGAPAEAIAAAAARAGVSPGRRWFIFVGGFGPHKRVDLIVRAHAALARRHPGEEPALLLVGPGADGFHQDIAGLRRLVDDCGTASLVYWPGFLPDEELRLLHSGAVALVLASESEGFGLPAVEAARCGTPVIATTSSPLPEVLEGGGVFVPPGNLEALTDAFERLYSNVAEQRALGGRAQQRADALSWPRSAAVALDALLEAAGCRAGSLAAAGISPT